MAILLFITAGTYPQREETEQGREKIKASEYISGDQKIVPAIWSNRLCCQQT